MSLKLRCRARLSFGSYVEMSLCYVGAICGCKSVRASDCLRIRRVPLWIESVSVGGGVYSGEGLKLVAVSAYVNAVMRWRHKKVQRWLPIQ